MASETNGLVTGASNSSGNAQRFTDALLSHDSLLSIPPQTMPPGLAISDTFNDSFWALASDWQASLSADAWMRWPEQVLPSGYVEAQPDLLARGPTSLNTSAACDAIVSERDDVGQTSTNEDHLPVPDELHLAYKRCLPSPDQWSALFKTLEALSETVHGSAVEQFSPFLDRAKLQKQLLQDTGASIDHSVQAACSNSQVAPSPSSEALKPSLRMQSQHQTLHPHLSTIGPDQLRRAWVLAALCLAESCRAATPIELPPRLGSRLEDPNAAISRSFCCVGTLSALALTETW